MYENYLLDADLIATYLKVSKADVAAALESAKQALKLPPSLEAGSLGWIEEIHGADALGHIFKTCVENRRYEKVKDGVGLTQLVIDQKSDVLDDVVAILKEMLQTPPSETDDVT